jgi:hypothetical protein
MNQYISTLVNPIAYEATKHFLVGYSLSLPTKNVLAENVEVVKCFLVK